MTTAPCKKQPMTKGVLVVNYSNKLSIQVPKSVQDNLNWIPRTNFSLDKSNDRLIVRKSDSGETIRKVNTSAYLPLELDLAQSMTWPQGKTLLMEATENELIIYEPEGLDFCLENLVESWLLIKLSEGVSSGQALKSLGKAVDRSFSPATLARWRSGGLPPAQAIDLMTQDVTGKIVQSCPITSANLPRVQKALSLAVEG